jgi:hypothetical protein
LLVALGLFGCGSSQIPVSAASINVRASDLPSDLMSCVSVPQSVKLTTASGEAKAREQGAVEFSAVNFTSDPSFCSTGQATNHPLRLVQAVVVRFHDAASAASAYRSNSIVGSQLAGPGATSGSSTGFGSNSAEFHTSPLIGNVFGLGWQRGRYIFVCNDANLTQAENDKLTKAVYQRTPSD